MIALLVATVASGSGSATVPVQGPVTFELRTYAAAVEVVQGPADSVTVATPGAPAARIEIDATAGRFEARVEGRRQVREGKVRLELPAGSKVEITTVTGAVDVSGALGELRARTMSGRVASSGAREADVETIDGAVKVAGAEGNVRVHTIAGAIAVDGSGPALQAEVETSSGQVDVRGFCGKGCRLDIDTVSGEVRLALDSRSSFGLRFTSHSGKLRDRGTSKGGNDAWTDAVWGAGEGRIECETFSADAIVSAR
jgi:DUF4097 and DUF4098 domain-containing protein YvlB